MTRPPRTSDDRWRNLMDGLGKSAAGAPDEDVLEEARDAHGDETRRAEEIRAAMLATVDEFEAGENERRVLPFVAAARTTAPERWSASRRLAAAAAAAVVAGSLAFAAYWRPAPPQVAATPPSVADEPSPVVTGSGDTAKNAASAEPASRPAPPSPPRRGAPPPRRTPDTGAPPSNTPPHVRTPDTGPQPVELAKATTVCVNFGLKTGSATASALREQIARQLGAGGLLTPIGDQNAADARLSITEAPGGHFFFLFMAANQMVWNEPARVAGPKDVSATADRIAQRITASVLDARQKAGASQ